MKSRWDAGQYKLRGKKHMGLSCRCCSILDLREEYENKQADREIRNTGVVAYELQKRAENIVERCEAKALIIC